MRTASSLSTRQVVDLLRIHNPKATELRLAAAIRAGKIPAPPVQAGRRIWLLEHVAAAATAFGIRSDLVLGEVL